MNGVGLGNELARMNYGKDLGDSLAEIGNLIRQKKLKQEAQNTLRSLTGVDLSSPEGMQEFRKAVFGLSALEKPGQEATQAIQVGVIDPMKFQETQRQKRFQEFKNSVSPIEQEIGLYQQRALVGAGSDSDKTQLQDRINKVKSAYPEFADQTPNVPNISNKFGATTLKAPNEWFIAGQGLHPEIKNPDDILGYAKAYQDWFHQQELLKANQYGGSLGEGWTDLTPEDKDVWYNMYITDPRNVPPFAYRDKESRTEWARGIADFAQRNNLGNGDIFAQRAEKDALSGSLKNQERIYGSMGQFVGNLNLQIDKVKRIMNDAISRVGARIVDLPRREWITRFEGSGNERVLESYLLEISSEIGKLSTGSQASVSELSASARERWDKIHDPNLSLGELVKILDATREQADLRQKSAKSNIDDTHDRIRKIGGTKPKVHSDWEQYEKK